MSTNETPPPVGRPYEIVEILDAAKLRARPDMLVVLVTQYQPKGTEGWVYRIKKINQRTAVLVPIAGSLNELTADMALLVEASEDEVERFRARMAGTEAAQLATGMVVKVAGPRWREPADALWVIVGLKGMTEVALSRLGGGDGKTYPKIPRSLVKLVPDAELPAAIAADPRWSGR